MTPRLRAMLLAPPDHVMDEDARACLNVLHVEIVTVGAEALIVFPNAPDAESTLAWARRSGMRTFDLRTPLRQN